MARVEIERRGRVLGPSADVIARILVDVNLGVILQAAENEWPEDATVRFVSTFLLAGLHGADPDALQTIDTASPQTQKALH
jgi:hypothetical protein